VFSVELGTKTVVKECCLTTSKIKYFSWNRIWSWIFQTGIFCHNGRGEQPELLLKHFTVLTSFWWFFWFHVKAIPKQIGRCIHAARLLASGIALPWVQLAERAQWR